MNLSRYTKFLLLGIGAALTVIQFQLIWNSGHHKALEPYFLCYAAVGFLIWQKRDRLKLGSSLGASITGILCIALVLLRGNTMVGYDSFLRLSPLLSGIGLALLSSGFSEFKRYWRELLVLAFLLIPTTSLLGAYDITGWTASLAGNLLFYTGQSVQQEGTRLMMGNGLTVDVYPGCSGAQSILQLLTLTFLFVIVFPLRWFMVVLLPVLAAAIAFFVNGIRVALMAILYSQSNLEAFDYWHLGNGSLIFSMAAVFLFGCVCYFFLEQSEDEGGAA
jgi:cyanoexosortase A